MSAQLHFHHVKEAAEFLERQTTFKPAYGIILGTGLSALVNDIEVVCKVAYSDIPHFPLSTVETHTGQLIFGTLSGENVVVMQGRFHYYEGYSMAQVTLPVRVLKLLGIQALIVSNAAGGLNSSYNISDIMLIEDHINLHYENPLTGKNMDEMGPRFPDMSEPYDHSLLEKAISLGKAHNISLQKGVYVSVPGPNLETPAEYRYLRTIGADAVGMSTVPEVIVARHMDLPVFALSVITDLCYPGKIKKVSVPDILAAASEAEPKMTQLIKLIISN